MNSVGREEHSALVTIGDTGPSVAPESADNLFTPFATTERDGVVRDL